MVPAVLPVLLQVLQLLELLLLLLDDGIHAIWTHDAACTALGSTFVLLFNYSVRLLLEGAVDDIVDAFLLFLSFQFLNFKIWF